jgi:hypothetical protein
MVLPQLAADGQPIETRQHPIENHELRRLLLDQAKRGRPVVRLPNDVSLRFQLSTDQVVDRDLVFDDEYRRHDQALSR